MSFTASASRRSTDPPLSMRGDEPVGGRFTPHWEGAVMRLLSLCFAILIAAPALAGAQPLGSLLPPDTHPGDRLTVTRTSGARFSGRFLVDNAGELVVRSHGRD